MSEPCMHNGACDGLYTVRESLQSSLHSNDARVLCTDQSPSSIIELCTLEDASDVCRLLEETPTKVTAVANHSDED